VLVVLDAAAAVDLLLGGGRSDWVGKQLAAEVVCAPHLLDVEVTGAFRRLVGLGAVTETRAATALTAFRALQIFRYGHVHLIPRMWELRGSVTAAAAAYVALAEVLDALLVTTDHRLARAPGLTARVLAP
jgi:predicted nucleic acid-binding protein